MLIPRSSMSDRVDNVSSEHLVPPTLWLRVWTRFPEKRDGPDELPQLSAQKM